MTPRALPPIQTFDTHQFEVPERGAAYLIGTGSVALVETGTPRAVPRLLDTLDGLDVAFVFVTHVHLDHSGGAGAIAARHPEATVVAHPRAIRHLADPQRLVAGVRAASPDLFPLYGEPTPIPERRLYPTGDGERFTLEGDAVIEAIHAPGHAPHHVCFFERSSATLFTGDAAGNHGIPVDVPLTVPPEFDRDAAVATLRRLRALRPTSLAYTHFGCADDDPETRLADYERKLVDWFARIEQLRRARDADEVVRAILADPAYERLAPSDRSSIEMCVRGALLTLENDAAS